jgi:predicted HTH transcriptional regulator
MTREPWGMRRRRADPELIEEIGRFARGEAFDEQPMPGLDSEALDFRAASESFAPVRNLRPPDLETMRLLTSHQGRRVPTVGGMLLFGRESERHFPDAWIQVGRFSGTDKSRILDRAEIRTLPVPAIDEAIAFVQKHSLHGAEIGTVRRRDRWNLLPATALRPHRRGPPAGHLQAPESRDRPRLPRAGPDRTVG